MILMFWDSEKVKKLPKINFKDIAIDCVYFCISIDVRNGITANLK